MQRRMDTMNDQNSFIIEWPFFEWKAVLPQAIGNDIFVWLYISLLINQNEAAKKGKFTYSQQSRGCVHAILRQKFPQLMNDLLIKDIEKRIEKDFCHVDKFNNLVLKDETLSFINSFEYLFSDEVEVKTIYKDAVTGAVLPFFEDINFKRYFDEITYKFEKEDKFKTNEPSARAVFRAKSLSEKIKKSIDPVAPKESLETVITDIQYEESEEIYEDDTIYLDDVKEIKEPENYAEAEKEKKNIFRSLKMISDSKAKCYFIVKVTRNESGLLTAECLNVPANFNNKAIEEWFAVVIRNNMLLDGDGFGKALLEKLPEPIIEETADSQVLIDLYAKNKSLNKCSELYEIVSHSKTKRGDLQLETIRLNDNFYSVAGFFHIGRLLDKLGETIPDNVIRSDDYDTYKASVKWACEKLKLTKDDAYKLTDPHIFTDYSRKNKQSDKLPFKAIFTNALINNFASYDNEFFYPEIVSDVWELYDYRSMVDHFKKDTKLKEEDIKKITRLARFIVSIQGGKIYE